MPELGSQSISRGLGSDQDSSKYLLVEAPFWSTGWSVLIVSNKLPFLAKGSGDLCNFLPLLLDRFWFPRNQWLVEHLNNGLTVFVGIGLESALPHLLLIPHQYFSNIHFVLLLAELNAFFI